MITYGFNKPNVTLQHWLLYHMIRPHTKIWLDERHDNMCLYNAYSITVMLWIRSHAHTHTHPQTHTHTQTHTHSPYNIYERVYISLNRYSHMHIVPEFFQGYSNFCGPFPAVWRRLLAWTIHVLPLPWAVADGWQGTNSTESKCMVFRFHETSIMKVSQESLGIFFGKPHNFPQSIGISSVKMLFS